MFLESHGLDRDMNLHINRIMFGIKVVYKDNLIEDVVVIVL